MGLFRRVRPPGQSPRASPDRRAVAAIQAEAQSVVIVRERNGKFGSAVFKSEGAALAWIKFPRRKGTLIQCRRKAPAGTILAQKFENEAHQSRLSAE